MHEINNVYVIPCESQRTRNGCAGKRIIMAYGARLFGNAEFSRVHHYSLTCAWHVASANAISAFPRRLMRELGANFSEQPATGWVRNSIYLSRNPAATAE
uniref:Uncharacterized protein n=1 Tax=Schistocephalus solidus TaxID=70667 RepID=A0A0X3PKH9_SCHSO